MKLRACFFFLFVLLAHPLFLAEVGVLPDLAVAVAADRDASMIEVLEHQYIIDENWEKIGKTKYVWKVTFRNHSNIRKRVFIYYYLLDAEDFPLARNVSNRYVESKQTVEIVADSYVMTYKVPNVVRGRVKLRVGFPN